MLSLALSLSGKQARKQASTHESLPRNRDEKNCSCEHRVSFHPDAITRRMIKGWCWSRARKEMTTGEMDPACLLQAMFPPQNHLKASSRASRGNSAHLLIPKLLGKLGPCRCSVCARRVAQANRSCSSAGRRKECPPRSLARVTGTTERGYAACGAATSRVGCWKTWGKCSRFACKTNGQGKDAR